MQVPASPEYGCSSQTLILSGGKCILKFPASISACKEPLPQQQQVHHSYVSNPEHDIGNKCPMITMAISQELIPVALLRLMAMNACAARSQASCTSFLSVQVFWQSMVWLHMVAQVWGQMFNGTPLHEQECQSVSKQEDVLF